MKRLPAPIRKGLFSLSQDWERDRVRVGEAELHGAFFPGDDPHPAPLP